MASIEQIKNDYHLFIDLQMNKYFELTGKKEFNSDIEAKLVIDEIIKIYNAQVAGEHLKLDNLNPVAKKQWFNSIKINFENLSNKINEPDDELDLDFDNVSKQFDEVFGFLPKGAMPVVIFCGPALESFGLPFDRFDALVKGEPATEFEKDLIEWGFEVAINVMDAALSKSQKKKQSSLKTAVEIAKDFLDTSESERVVETIYKNIIDAFEVTDSQINKTTNKKMKK